MPSFVEKHRQAARYISALLREIEEKDDIIRNLRGVILSQQKDIAYLEQARLIRGEDWCPLDEEASPE